MGRRLKVLALVTRLPLPPWRGDQVRSYHHLRLLAARHDITVCATVLGRASPTHAEAVRALGLRLQVVELGLAGAAPALGRALLGDRRPLQVLLYARRRAQARVRALLHAEHFDVVHAQLVRTAALWPDGARPPVVLDLVDALSSNFARRAARDRGPLARVSALEAGRLAHAERMLVARAASTLVVSAAEREHVVGERVRVVPNGVDLDAFRYRDGGRTAGRIVFAGNLGYFPNVDAARWLVEELLPRVRARRPEASVHLVGARPHRLVRRLAAHPGVTLAADVQAMGPEIAGAAVAVVPMRSGSGLQNKVLEAMAVGTPVVTTPGVAAALDVRPGEHLLVADGATALADATAALLADPERARRIAEAARAAVERGYRWETSAAAVETAWADAVAGE